MKTCDKHMTVGCDNDCSCPMCERDALAWELTIIKEEFDRTVEHFENKGKGGQQVTFTGDFCAVGPSVVSRMRWWSRRWSKALKKFGGAT